MKSLKHLNLAIVLIGLLANNVYADTTKTSTSDVITGEIIVDDTPSVIKATGENIRHDAATIDKSQSSTPTNTHREQLPGVGNYKVNNQLTMGSTVKVTGDGTELVVISNKFPNRISTPFEHAKVIELDKAPYSIKPSGSSLFLITHSLVPFVIYVTGQNTNDPVISLTMLPRDIPTQSISLQLNSTGVNKTAEKRESKNSNYEHQLVDMLRSVASGTPPEGFSESDMPNILASQHHDGIQIIPLRRYSGAYLDIYKYKVDNNQQHPIELSETSFYQKGVKAVSIFPKVLLNKGDTTTVYVVADKTLLEGEVK